MLFHCHGSVVNLTKERYLKCPHLYISFFYSFRTTEESSAFSSISVWTGGAVFLKIEILSNKTYKSPHFLMWKYYRWKRSVFYKKAIPFLILTCFLQKSHFNEKMFCSMMMFKWLNTLNAWLAHFNRVLILTVLVINEFAVLCPALKTKD